MNVTLREYGTTSADICLSKNKSIFSSIEKMRIYLTVLKSARLWH
jgi:hypothetical protein